MRVKMVNFGAFFFAAVGVPMALAPGPVVQDDLSSLPNHATATVTVCTNSKGAIQSPGTCLVTVTDLQPTTSVVGEVRVT